MRFRLHCGRLMSLHIPLRVVTHELGGPRLPLAGFSKTESATAARAGEHTAE